MQEFIRSVKARKVDIPLEMPLWIGGSQIVQRDYCFVEVSTTMDRTGYAIGFARGADLASIIIEQIVPHIMKYPVDCTEKIWEAMYDNGRLNGRQGMMMRAISLIDIALWDLKAKNADLPLHTLLGGYRESIPLLMSGGYYAKDKDLGKLQAEFLGYAEQGFKHLKLMVGGATMEEDMRRFTALRKCLPETVSLGVDANGAWKDAKAVKRWIEKAGKETSGLSFVEEPLPPEQMEQMSWLCNQVDVPIAAGEFLAGRWTFKQYISSGCMNIVRADATLCGGITEWKRIAALAAAYNLSLLPHYFASIHIHVGLALPGCGMIEVVSTEGRNSNYHLIVGTSYRQQDGMAYPNNAPGLGLTIDPVLLNMYTSKILSSG